MDPAEVSRFLQHYAKRYHAGAFAVPSAKDIAADPLSVRVWGDSGARTVAVAKRLKRDSRRADFTGSSYLLPAGSHVVSHVAHDPGAPVPDLDDFDLVYAYREDAELSAGLVAQGRVVRAVRISAASEVIAAWGRDGSSPASYPLHDVATVTELPFNAPPALRDAALAEVDLLDSWHDDFPYYSDGSWGSVSLRGFDPTNPTWGIKPAEMSKGWWAEHPEAADLASCDWTTLASACPALMRLIWSVPWWPDFERVRLLRMAGRGGRGGQLSRHTDITDRSAGTADGQIARFHLPLVTDPAITMSAWDLDGHELVTHLAPWRLYYLDQRKPHAVSNPTGVDRVHLVVDVIVNDEVRHHIGAAA